VTLLVDPSLYYRERALDAERGGTVVRFKSWIAVEVYGSSADVKVDYDESNPPRKTRFLRLMNSQGDLEFEDVFGYRTTKGVHLRAWFSTSTWGRLRNESALSFDDNVLVVQSQLGDDPRRQAFNAARVSRGVPNWNVLWNVKLRNGVVVSRERQDPIWTERFRRWLRVEKR
jgi:hypothetical protein